MCSQDDLVSNAFLDFQKSLTEAGLLIPAGVAGVYALGGRFEGVVQCFNQCVTRAGLHFGAEVMQFPPIFNRRHYLSTGHVRNFPDLMGSIHSFTGNERDHMAMLGQLDAAADWTGHLSPTGVMMVPAACYPLYPTATGILPEGGRTVDLCAYVYRHEPSEDPARMQSFRQREYVRLGTPEEALAHRNWWLNRAQELLHSLGLEVNAVLADDPFFGRGGRMMAVSQKEQDLKYELVATVASAERPTAIASCNYHLGTFGEAFDIKTADGETAHSACIGFGLERVALALFRAHGLELLAWPTRVRRLLAL